VTRRRLNGLSARELDGMRAAHDERELARRDREERLPVDDDVDPAEELRAWRWRQVWLEGSFDDFRAWKLGD
jgi:hypothetical protein